MNLTAIAFATVLQATGAVPGPGYRLGDWAVCRDGTQIYERNPLYPLEAPAENPCRHHGGMRAYGPGLRLNEKGR